MLGLHVSTADGALRLSSDDRSRAPSPPAVPRRYKAKLTDRAAVADEDVAELNLGEKKKKKKKKVVLEVAVRSRRAARDCVRDKGTAVDVSARLR